MPSSMPMNHFRNNWNLQGVEMYLLEEAVMELYTEIAPEKMIADEIYYLSPDILSAPPRNIKTDHLDFVNPESVYHAMQEFVNSLRVERGWDFIYKEGRLIGATERTSDSAEFIRRDLLDVPYHNNLPVVKKILQFAYPRQHRVRTLRDLLDGAEVYLVHNHTPHTSKKSGLVNLVSDIQAGKPITDIWQESVFRFCSPSPPDRSSQYKARRRYHHFGATVKAHFVVTPISCYRHDGESTVYLVNTDPSITELFLERGVRIVGQAVRKSPAGLTYPEVGKFIRRALRYNFVAGPMVLGYGRRVSLSGDFSGLADFDRVEPMRPDLSGGPDIMRVSNTNPESMIFLAFDPRHVPVSEEDQDQILSLWREGYSEFFKRNQMRTGIPFSRVSLSAILVGGIILTLDEMLIVDFDYISGQGGEVRKIDLRAVPVGAGTESLHSFERTLIDLLS